MKTLLLALAIVLYAVSAQAQSVIIDLGTGSVTMNPTAGQVTAIQRLTDIANALRTQENISRAQQVPPLTPLTMLTREEYIRNLLVSTVQSHFEQVKKLNADDACVNYKAATQTVRNQIDAALGGSPCI